MRRSHPQIKRPQVRCIPEAGGPTLGAWWLDDVAQSKALTHIPAIVESNCGSTNLLRVAFEVHNRLGAVLVPRLLALLEKPIVRIAQLEPFPWLATLKTLQGP